MEIVFGQAAPLAGQIVGTAMTTGEVYSFGKTAYRVYVNVDKIKEDLQRFYYDPEVVIWIRCLPPEESDKLAVQLGEIIGSAIANKKKGIIKKHVALGKTFLSNNLKSSGGRRLTSVANIS